MPELITTIDLHAAPEVVWAVLADLRGWDRWSPVLTGMRGRAVPGARLRFRVRLAGAPALPMWARVLRAESRRELRWQGGVRRILSGEHYFLICPRANGGVRLVNGERFSGALSRIFIRGGLATRIVDGLHATNRALQLVVERTEPGPGRARAPQRSQKTSWLRGRRFRRL